MKIKQLVGIACVSVLALTAWAQPAEFGPGWHNAAGPGKNVPFLPKEGVNPARVQTVTKGLLSQPSGPRILGLSGAPSSTGAGASAPLMTVSSLGPGGGNAADQVTPEIQELARGLLNDPVKIFYYVRNNIDYEHYFGSKKGAMLTLLERSGNDFDQAALLAALLHAAGYTADYRFGLVQFPYNSPDNNDLMNWVGYTQPNTNFNYVYTNLFNTMFALGYPMVWSYGDGTNVWFHHAWVAVTINGNVTEVDPSFKTYKTYPGINLPVAAAVNRTNLLSAAGGTTNANWVQNLNESQVATYLTNYTSNLLNAINGVASNANASPLEIVGGRSIIPVSSASLPAGLPFTTINGYWWQSGGSWYWIDTSPNQWSVIPDVLMTGMNVTVGSLSTNIPMPTLSGQRLCLNFETTNAASLWLDDTLMATSAVSTASNTVSVGLTINHFHGEYYIDVTNGNTFISDTGRNDHSTTNSYIRSLTNSTPRYSIMYAFKPTDVLLRKRQEKLDSYIRAGLTNGSREVASETLNLLGLTWLFESERNDDIVGIRSSTLRGIHHRVGRMAQEAGFYVDVYMQLTSSFPSDSDWVKFADAYTLAQYFNSAMEHGVIEQLQGTNTAISTVKIMQIANNGGTGGQKIFRANVTNYAASVRPSLSNYSTTQLDYFNSLVTNGATILLPQSGSTVVGRWSGSGYAAAWSNSISMIIGGNFFGGISLSLGNVNFGSFTDLSTTYPAGSSGTTVAGGYMPYSLFAADPVRMTDGAFVHDKQDLVVGQAEPRGLQFSRHYESARRYHNLTKLGYGWTHNYYITAREVSSAPAALGLNTPQEMAPYLAAVIGAMDVYRYNASAKEWAVTALIAKWAVDQVRSNAVAVTLGKDVVQFIKQPMGSYSSPAGVTMTLTNVAGTYKLMERQGSVFTFDTNAGEKPVLNISNLLNQKMTFTYAADKRLTSVADAFGRALTFAYNGTNSLASVTDNASRVVSFTYGSTTNLTGGTDAEGKTTTYTYDTNRQMTSVVDPLNRVITTNIYDSFGRVTQQFSQGDTNKAYNLYWSGYANVEQDPTGALKTYLYDLKARPIGVMDAASNTAVMVYDGQDHVIRQVSPLLETNTMIYDANHNAVASIDPLGNGRSNRYDSLFRLTNSIDARGFTNTFAYNAQHQLTNSTDPYGNTVKLAYNNITTLNGALNGTLSTKTDPAGNVTTYAYDTFGEVLAVTYPSGLGVEGYLRDNLGNVTTKTNARGFTTAFAFNKRRELTNTVAPTNLTVRVTYDAAANVATAVDALGNVVTNVYSATQKLLSTKLPPVAAGTALTTNVYDRRDLLVASTNPLGQATTMSYNSLQRVAASANALGQTVTFAYDLNGRQTASTNPLGLVNGKLYNARGEVTTATDPAGYAIRYVYDANGNRTALTNRNSGAWTFQYDLLNRLTNTVTPTGKATALAYNSRGLLTTVKLPSGQLTTNTYDALGRLTNRADLAGTNTYRYDSNGNLTNVVAGTKSKVRVFDAYDRVVSYADGEGNTNQFKYDSNGNVTNLVYPDGKVVKYFYNARNQVTNVTDWASRVTTIQYDLAGQVTNVIRPNGTTRALLYDAAGRTTEIWERTAAGTPITVYKQRWDVGGRLTNEFMAPLPHAFTPPVQNLTYDADNRIGTHNGSSVTHDVDGNMTFGPLLDDTRVTYAYNARNQLTNVTGTTYTYDSEGNRVSVVASGVTNRWAINPHAGLSQGLVRTRVTATTTNHTFYVHGLGLLYEVDAAGNARYYHYDYRGSTVAITDAAGAVTDRVEYSLYGTTTYRSGTNDTPFLYNGRYGVQTDGNGLLHMRARFYNPYLKRFLNADPSGFNGGMNFYAYADGNPVSYLDPFGLQAVGENSTSTWVQFVNVLKSGDTWLQRLAYTGQLHPSDDVMESAVNAAGDYAYDNGGVRGFFVAAGGGGKLSKGTYMPGYLAGGELNWTIEGDYGGQLAVGGGLQMRGQTTVVGLGTTPYVSEQFGIAGTYSWNQASGGFTAGQLGAQLYGGQANKLGGYGFQGDFDNGQVELGITYGNVSLGIIIDPSRVWRNFVDSFQIITGTSKPSP